MSKFLRILVIDDEPDMLENCDLILAREGYQVATLSDSSKVGQALEQFEPDLILTDLTLPDKDGIEVLREVKYSHTDVPVVIMTAYATIETAVTAMKEGAEDYLVKPFSKDQLLHLVKRCLKSRELILENRQLRQELGKQKLDSALIALSPRMQEILSVVSRVANTEASVLIQGESGVGKEVIARAIHEASRKSAGPFVAVNCSALPNQLMESELFGHERGAFTGAISTRKGLMEEANGGTFFMDEVTEMDGRMQVKLLRVLQERKLRRVGGNREIDLDFRLIGATNRNAQIAVQKKTLREDLYFRMAVVTLKIPPLRERREDIPALALHFLREVGREYGREFEGFSPQVNERFEAYAWPGNVRELRNVVERAVSLAANPIIREGDLPEELRVVPIRKIGIETTEPYESAKSKILDQFQREYFTTLLVEEKNNISRVAVRAQVDRKTVYRILGGYGLDRKLDESDVKE